MNGEIILGQVCNTWLAGTQQIALLEPLYMLSEETGLWVDIEYAETKFPNRGRVTWAKPADDAIVGSVWVFTYEQHPVFDASDPRRDRYRINWDRPPILPHEVINLRAKDADEVFKTVNRGLSLSYVPSSSIYIVLDAQTWAGPLKLVQQQGRWALDPHGRNLPIPRLSALPEAQLVKVYIDSQRTFLPYSNAQPLRKVGELDWSPDYLVIKRLLNASRERGRLARLITLTKAAIQDSVDSMPSDSADTTAQQVTRARGYLTDAERVKKELQSFEGELLALPAVAERIAQAERDGRESARAQAEAEAIAQAQQELERLREEHRQITSSLAGLRQAMKEAERRISGADRHAHEAVDLEMERRADDIASLERQSADRRRNLEAELEALNKQIAERRQQISDQLTLADASITQRVAELVARPAEALAQIALVRAAMGGAQPALSPSSGAYRDILPPASVLQDDGGKVDDQQKLVLAARRALSAAGLPGLASVPIHAALVAGKMPLVSGARALDALEQYACVAAAGRMLWVPVAPTTLEPADILGKHDPHSRQFAPHPGGLLDLLIYARQPDQQDRLFVAVLEGVNRAAVDAYLLPLLACYRSARCDSARRTMRLAHPNLFAAEDPYFAAAELAWPANVLLAGTIIDGPATVSLPPSLWADAFYIDLDSTTGSVRAPSYESTARSSIPLSRWSSWQSLSTGNVQTGLDTLESLSVDGLRLPAPIGQAFARTYTVCCGLVKTSEEALRVAVHGSLVPYALASQQTEALTQLLETTSIKLDEAALEMMRMVLQ